MTRKTVLIAAAAVVLTLVVGVGVTIGLSLNESNTDIAQVADTESVTPETTTTTSTLDIEAASDYIDELAEDLDFDPDEIMDDLAASWDEVKPWFLAHGFEDSPAGTFEMTAFTREYAQAFNDGVGFEAVGPLNDLQFFSDTMFVTGELEKAYESSGASCETFDTWFSYYTDYPDSDTAWLAAMQLAHGMDLFSSDSAHLDTSVSCFTASFEAVVSRFEG